MKPSLAHCATAALFVASVTGRAKSPAEDGQADIEIEYTACTEPCPEICTCSTIPSAGKWQMVKGRPTQVLVQLALISWFWAMYPESVRQRIRDLAEVKISPVADKRPESR